MYKVYNIELDIKNESIAWIGLVESEGTIGDSAQLYYNPNLKRTALLDVMTFAEATKKWGLADSTLRKLVATDKVVEGIDYRKSGGTWIIVVDTMIRLYGKPKAE